MSRALFTKRQALAHISVCLGCCCGRTDKGHPDVPVQWLKDQWKARRLLKHVQLTISGCLGPCDLTNVVSIGSSRGTTWLGGLTRHVDYEHLLQWATQVAETQRLLPLPKSLEPFVFERFRAASGAALEDFR